MAEKKPDDLAWETSLLDERIISESQRLDRLVRSLKWAFVGAAAMALAFGLFVWLPNQQFSYVIWWDSVADDPDYCKIVYRLDGEEKSMRLFLDPEDHECVIGCAGEPGMAEAMDAAELLKKPGGLDALSERANQAIEAMGGTVLRHELWPVSYTHLSCPCPHRPRQGSCPSPSLCATRRTPRTADCPRAAGCSTR